MTAIETLEFMGGLSGIKKMELTKRIPIILEQVRLSDEMNSRVGAFSGGMKQRLGIAQALLHKPSFIVMDEPVSALDPIGRREVLNLINEIKKETTILLSTHILGDAEEICERFVVIKNGRKIEDTSLEDLLNKNQIIGMKLTQMDQDWLRAIKHMDFVKRVEVKGNDIKLEVDDIQRDKIRLLESALLHKVDLMKFEVNANRLEEIFLKLVVDK
ncbi:putative ABC transporter ATP-binding protein YxlF [compost metagenome]